MRKIPALQGPLISWTRTKGWQFLPTWGARNTLVHPYGLAVRLTERGEAATEAKRLMRNHGRQVGSWYLLRTEMVPKLRPVWVAGFRRCPTDVEILNEYVMTAEQLETWTAKNNG